MPNGTHFYVITVEKAIRPGAAANCTSAGTFTPNTGTTRSDAYQEIYNRLVSQHPELAGASVLFFSLEPNQL